MPESWIDYLNRLDVERLELTNDEILDAVERGLRLQGQGESVIEPRVHLEPGVSNGHFNVLRGSLGGDIDIAGVKVVGDFVDNYKVGLPSELALLNLMDRRTGQPRAVIDASYLTDMRTGAVTALGAKHLARKGSKVLGHVGARGTAYWNVRLLDHLFDFDEIRVHSLRPESREAFARTLSEDLGKPVVATTDWESCVRGADIVVAVPDGWASRATALLGVDPRCVVVTGGATRRDSVRIALEAVPSGTEAVVCHDAARPL
ncbi:MAG: 2-C-methyl-D-erythritol 4-phosphate cytidylyltransferase, partial [Ilumatobacteraceae bacterium]